MPLRFCTNIAYNCSNDWSGTDTNNTPSTVCVIWTRENVLYTVNSEVIACNIYCHFVLKLQKSVFSENIPHQLNEKNFLTQILFIAFSSQ